MKQLTQSPQQEFIFNFTRAQALMYRRLDSGLGGIGLNEYIILHHLASSPDKKMRRVDLADKLGLTASGVTRMLLPMEKIGLIKREAHERDERVSFVVLAPGGKTKLEEAQERIDLYIEDTFGDLQDKKIDEMNSILKYIQ